MRSADHYAVALEQDAEGWWPGNCKCGWKGGSFPTTEDACDALMEHAFTEGYRLAVWDNR